jgi:hypothetical protein
VLFPFSLSCRGAVGQAGSLNTVCRLPFLVKRLLIISGLAIKFVAAETELGITPLPKRAFSVLRLLIKSRGVSGEAPAEGVPDEVGQPLQVEFPQDVLAVPSHRVDADIQEVRNFLGSLAFHQELDDGLFPGGQGIGVGRLVPQGQIRHLGRQEG